MEIESLHAVNGNMERDRGFLLTCNAGAHHEAGIFAGRDRAGQGGFPFDRHASQVRTADHRRCEGGAEARVLEKVTADDLAVTLGVSRDVTHDLCMALDVVARL